MSDDFDLLETNSNEKTEKVDGRSVSKAEKLARLMWDAALGKSYGTGGLVIQGKPDKAAQKAIIERMEGKPAQGSKDAGKKKKKTVADNVSEQAMDAIAQAGGLPNAR